MEANEAFINEEPVKQNNDTDTIRSLTDKNITQDSIGFEQQKIDIEQRKLEIEREKLFLEKSKEKTHRILSLIPSIISLILVMVTLYTSNKSLDIANKSLDMTKEGYNAKYVTDEHVKQMELDQNKDIKMQEIDLKVKEFKKNRKIELFKRLTENIKDNNEIRGLYLEIFEFKTVTE